MNPLRRSLLLAFVALLSACTVKPAERPAAAPKLGSAGAGGTVAMPDSYSAEAAARILSAGGNAVDAAVAGALVLAVTYPEAGNLGGGGFMLTYVDGVAQFLDYRETAPAAATRDMYLDARGEVIEGLSLTGHRAVGVPGTVAGLWAAHQRYGKLPWRDVIEPAVRLAQRGFQVPPLLAERATTEQPRFQRTNFARYFGRLRQGASFRQPELASTLQRIQKSGAAGFYEGETADLIVSEMRRGGGLITSQDLRTYRAVWRAPLRSTWRDQTLLSSPPPSSGGFALLQLLGMKDARASDFEGLEHNSAQYVHLVAEIAKRVYADRAEYAGDADFVDVPIGRLVDPAYLRERAAGVNPHAISAAQSVGPGLAEPRHTTHFSIIDRWGNAVANTYTLNSDFGSGVVVAGAGFLLNNEMDDFSAKAGVPNVYGLLGGDANSIQPGKRMLSSMSPTILLDRDGRVALVAGSMGGSTIITGVFQVLVDVVDFRMTALQAVSAPRFHHQGVPVDLLTFDGAFPPVTLEALRQRGYRVEPHEWPLGDVQLIVRTRAGWDAASDPRGRGEVRRLP
jgi:gamma-glutamyltranspeptidase/glutathione hydrolase